MTDPTAAFAKMVPGFDFLQGLVKGAGAALPSAGQWVAPTLNPEEIEKRIGELKTVQYWLEQNARMLGLTIQALEVQRMTLSTLKAMNLSFGDLAESLKIRPSQTMSAPEPVAPTTTDVTDAADAKPQTTARGAAPETAGTAGAVPAGVVDPLQWYGALTQQFTELATQAVKGGGTELTKSLAGNLVKQGLDAASDSLKKAAGMPMAAAKSVVSQMASAASGRPARKTPAVKQPTTKQPTTKRR